VKYLEVSDELVHPDAHGLGWLVTPKGESVGPFTMADLPAATDSLTRVTVDRADLSVALNYLHYVATASQDEQLVRALRNLDAEMRK